jgi:hypothetical protein
MANFADPIGMGFRSSRPMLVVCFGRAGELQAQVRLEAQFKLYETGDEKVTHTAPCQAQKIRGGEIASLPLASVDAGQRGVRGSPPVAARCEWQATAVASSPLGNRHC